jgi:hypothetical protein
VRGLRHLVYYRPAVHWVTVEQIGLAAPVPQRLRHCGGQRRQRDQKIGLLGFDSRKILRPVQAEQLRDLRSARRIQQPGLPSEGSGGIA